MTSDPGKSMEEREPFLLAQRGGIVAPLYFWNMTARERREICNGAGPAGKLLWIAKASLVPDTFFGLRITAAANAHDAMYEYGRTWADKRNADRVFLFNMISLVDERTTRRKVLGTILRVLRWHRAWIYFLAVRFMGYSAFKKKSKGRKN